MSAKLWFYCGCPVLGDEKKADGIQHVQCGRVLNFDSEHPKAETLRKNMHTYCQWDALGRTTDPHHKINLVDFFACYRKRHDRIKKLPFILIEEGQGLCN